MPKRFSVICLFAAWLCASGAALDGVQVYAWCRMFVGYAHQMPVQRAVVETMDASKPCPLCCALRRTREQSQRQQPPAGIASDAAKLILIMHELAPLVFARECEAWPIVIGAPSPSRVDPVPLPPPRTAVAEQVV